MAEISFVNRAITRYFNTNKDESASWYSKTSKKSARYFSVAECVFLNILVVFRYILPQYK